MVYLDHSQLAGDELELVKIANLAAEHQNDGDEQAYFSLFDSKRDPNMKMASYKITKMLLESVSVKSETSALIVALVPPWKTEKIQGYTVLLKRTVSGKLPTLTKKRVEGRGGPSTLFI
ncbi:hypothetical protein JJQ72_14840 [Paenibacillus sp. F411]|uniref:hypothetical protein n=1 Tax=Paenibacillus sp. F411 TaxID=2820239 RepID=UPI001AAED4A8|nr:hypothetical protein [Paenibacillus sp. F411]MBO2945253.1 hypothetical protein [Paenibacillus sp. F411]